MKMLKKVSNLLLLAVILVGSVSVVAAGRSPNNEKFKKHAKETNRIAKNK